MVSEKINLAEKQLTEKQKSIYGGLYHFGKQLSFFYYDCVMIVNNPIYHSSCNLLAHLAREIDSGIRGVVSNRDEKSSSKNKEKKHLKSICKTLGCDEEDEFANQWYDVANKFASFAHRVESGGTPRELSEFLTLWKRYEEILLHIIGSYYKLLDIIDRILIDNDPTNKDTLSALPNLLDNNARSTYFFNKLNDCKWIEPLSSKGFFSPDNNPKPQKEEEGYIISYWDALGYLVRMSSKCSSKQETDMILSIVNRIIDYEEAEEKIDNMHTNLMILDILCNMPEKISEEHIHYITSCLNSKFYIGLFADRIQKSLIPSLIDKKNRSSLIELIKLILKPDLEYGDERKISSLLNRDDIKEIIFDNVEAMTLFAAEDMYQIAYHHIKNICEKKQNYFSVYAIPKIEDMHEVYSYNKYGRSLITLLISSLQKHPNREIILEQLVQEECTIFKRVGIHVIGSDFERYKCLFYEHGKVLFEVDHCKPELYSLMLKNAKNMTDEEIKNILDWIENKSYFVSKEIKGEKEQVEKIIAYEKKELLSALLPSEKDIVKERYEQYDSVNSEPLCHPGVYISVESFEGYESPVSEETMAMMSSEEILTLLQQFKEKGSFGVPSELGLANTLEACIAKNPQKFVSHLYVYESVDPLYVYSILKGLSDAFEKGVIFDLEPVFDYIDKILPRILHVKGDKEHHMNWLIGQIATFIQKGTTKDENSFEIDLMHRSKEILISLNDRVIAKNESHENAVSYTINTEKGKILSAMLCLSLWYARNKPTEKRWVQDIKDIFDYELHNEKTIELITTISSHIRHFMYLDKEWVLDNIDEIFFISDETLWKSAMQGYLQFPHPTNKMFM